MNEYAVIAFATPVTIALLGWVAVLLHARGVRRDDAERAAEAARRDR